MIRLGCTILKYKQLNDLNRIYWTCGQGSQNKPKLSYLNGFAQAQPLSKSALSQLSPFWHFFTSAPNSALDKLSPSFFQLSPMFPQVSPRSTQPFLNSALFQLSLLEMRWGASGWGVWMGLGGVAPPLGGRLSKKSDRVYCAFWIFFQKGLSWERAELGEGWTFFQPHFAST